jgi:arylsulfatase A-like enzyme
MPLNIILVTVDCLRADHCGFMGAAGEPACTPRMDALASSSVVWDRAITAGMPTYYAFPAIMASRFPLALGRDVVGLAPDEPTLTSVLRQQGFDTAAFIAANPYLSRHFGYHQGFKTYSDSLAGSPAASGVSATSRAGASWLSSRAGQWLGSRRAGALYHRLYRQYAARRVARRAAGQMGRLRRYPAAHEIVSEALRWLRRHNPNRPFLLWLHLMDPHHPYYPPEQALEMVSHSRLAGYRSVLANMIWDGEHDDWPTAEESIRALYRASVRWADEQMGHLIESLYSLGLWDNTIFAFTSDHGEELRDHGGRYHFPQKLAQELIRVPLLVRHPGVATGSRVDQVFSLIDLAPTLLGMAGIEPPEAFTGQNRWSGQGITGGPAPVAFTECVYNCRNPWHADQRLGQRLASVQGDRFKLVINFATGDETLFDLAADPAEAHPLPPDRFTEVRGQLLHRMLDHLRISHARQNSLPRLRARLSELKRNLGEQRHP